MMCNIMMGHYCSSSYFEQYFYFYSIWLLHLSLSAGGLPEGKKPCSWNSCMTRARRWSRVLRRDEQGTRSKSPRRSSPSVEQGVHRITINTPFGAVLQLLRLMLPVVPALSKVKMSPSHLAALLGVLGSELQLERRRVFLLGELGSSAVTSNSGHMTRQGWRKGIRRKRGITEYEDKHGHVARGENIDE